MKDPADGSKGINRRIDELALEYEQTPLRDPRRAEIASEISTLRLLLEEIRAVKK
jgi:hypothetical protein